MNWCILIPLLVGAICALLGYLLGRFLASRKYNEYKAEIAGLKTELDACKASKVSALSGLEQELKTTKASLSNSISSKEADIASLENELKTTKLSLESTNSSKVSIADELKQVKASLASSISSKEADMSGLESQLKTAKVSLESANTSKTSLENELKQVKASLASSISSREADMSGLESQLKTTKQSLESANSSKVNLESQLKQTQTSLEACLKSKADMAANTVSAAPALIPFNGDAAKAVFGKKITQDNLTVVEGIGPKIQQLFHDFNIKTWKALSETSIEKCQEVLNSGGDRYRIHKPNTWPKQAELAYQGKWAELLKWQDELDGGK